jgi:anti-sigma B factor antagonist
MTPEAPHGQSFGIRRYGEIAVVTPAPEVESMSENLIQQAAAAVLAPLAAEPPNGLVVDLSKVAFFGSVFISFLLKCHLQAKKQGIEMVLAGASPRAKELLHLTALDTLWALYDNLDEALDALRSSD